MWVLTALRLSVSFQNTSGYYEGSTKVLYRVYYKGSTRVKGYGLKSCCVGMHQDSLWYKGSLKIPVKLMSKVFVTLL